jgi:neutral ceramidase
MPAAHPPLPPPDNAPSEILVGASRVDITPPPGPSTFGHGPGARVAVGYWTRLYCRAFYFETQVQRGQGVAFVTCELPQISTLLQRHAAARLRDLPASRLMLVATHTHAGPGHYFESENLGGMTSAHFPGFDPKMVEFLSERIARAVEQARSNKRPASLRWLSSEIWELTRNRSLTAYRANTRPFRAKPPDRTSLPAGTSLSEEQLAIDPALRILQIEWREANAPIGLIVFYAMHPTVVRNRNRYFGGDVFGVAARLLEQELRRKAIAGRGELACALGPSTKDCFDPVAALVNTNEGDIVPVWSTGETDEAKLVGARLANEIWATRVACDQPAPDAARPVSCGGWAKQASVDLRYIEAKLPGASRLVTPSEPRPARLCERAELGLAASLGGSDHPTTVEGLLASGETTVDYGRVHCQAPKVPFLGFVQKLLPSGAFPEQVPLALLRLHGTWISFVPAELTITTGDRLNTAVRSIARLADPNADAVVAGLANGYIQYVATPEEYDVQRYEGGSTLYGRATAPYLEQVFEYLARHMIGQDVSASLTAMTHTKLGAAEAFEYTTAPERSRLWQAEWDAEQSELDNRGPGKLCRIQNTEPTALCFRWTDVGPGRAALTTEPWILIARKSTLETRFDDRGIDFMTRVHGRSGRAWVWSTVFRPSLAEWNALPPDERLEFVVRAGAAPLRSAAFSVKEPPPPCTREDLAAFCNRGF